MLQAVGYEVGEIDGNFDAEMTTAVEKFQADNKLEVTGKLTGETTYSLMDKIREKVVKDDPQLQKAKEIVKEVITK